MIKTYVAKMPNIIEHLLHESSSQATIDPLLYVAMSIYIILSRIVLFLIILTLLAFSYAGVHGFLTFTV